MQFGHLDIGYDATVLEPRPWTSSQSQWAADLLVAVDNPPARVLELCAGAGHIGLLALSLAGSPAIPHTLVSVDVNPVACDFTRSNAEAAGLEALVDTRAGRIDDVITPGERFDLVIADPPWVERAQTGRFPADPLVAIDGGPDGLDVAWQCIRAGESHLVLAGSMVLQLGSTQQYQQVREGLTAVAPQLTIRETRSFGSRGILVGLTKEADRSSATC